MVRLISVLLASLILASDAWAQFDTPSFLPPRPGDDIGIYVSDLDRADYSLQGIWRQGGNLNLGLRLGYIDYGRDGAVVVGAESWDLLTRAGPNFPVDVAWTLGVGAAFNGGTRLEIPVGLTIGRVLPFGSMRLQLYGHPRLAVFINPDASDEVNLDGLFDLGLDAILNQNLKLRLGTTLGVRDAVGIGIAYRSTRGAIVR